jgi:hypothetical protein
MPVLLREIVTIQIQFLLLCQSLFTKCAPNALASMWGLGLRDGLPRPCMLAIVELNLR